MIGYYKAYLVFVAAAVKIATLRFFTKKDYRTRYCKHAFDALNAPIEVKGELHKDTQMVMLNHQSFVDIFLLEAVSDRSLSWMSKVELLKVPFLGYMLKAFKMILVERENKAGLVKLLKDVKARVDEGRVVAIFPEGTRIKQQKLGKFKGGAKLMASKHGLQVQPVVVLGSRTLLNEKHKTHTPTTMKVIFLPPVEQDDKQWYERVQTDMQEVIDYEFEYNHCSR